MIDLWEELMLTVDTSSIILKFVSSIDTTSDWSIFIEFSLHFCFSWESVIVADIVFLELNGSACFLASLTDWAWWWDAVFAEILSLAFSSTISLFAEIKSNILFTRWIWDTISVSIFPDTTWVSTFTITTSFTVYDNLSIQSNRGWVSEVGHDVESISKSWSSTLGPAWATVNWNMLIFTPWKIVDTIDVTPVPVVWKVGLINFIPGILLWWSFSVFEGSFFSSASFALQEFWFNFWEFLHEFLVQWIISLLLSGMMSLIIGPCIFWSTPGTIGLDSNVVGTSDNSEETLFSPMGSPGVSDSPVLGTIVSNTESSDWDIMNDIGISSGIVVNTTCVIF